MASRELAQLLHNRPSDMDLIVEDPKGNANSEEEGTEARAEGPDLLSRYLTTRRTTDELTEPLSAEDFVVQSMEDVSPTKWHLAHTSWFWEAFVLSPHLNAYEPCHPLYHYLFNSYYVQAGERHCRAQRGYLSRPTVQEVRAYRAHVDAAMGELLSRDSDSSRSPGLTRLIELGIQHEQQHQELILTDLKHVFSVNPLRPSYLPAEDAGWGSSAWESSRTSAGTSPPAVGSADNSLRWLSYEGGLQEIGYHGEGFHFDNEGPRHRRFVEPFLLADRLATNGEYLAFLEDGGYERAELWMSEGWARREAEDWTEPFYWESGDGKWWVFTLNGMRPLDPREPVCHLTWFEADAFARWSGARLPREDEWEVAAGGVAIEGNLAETGRFHPTPADAPPRPNGTSGNRDGHPSQMFGDVWEWTSSAYSPYPGYRPAEGVIGEYNGKFMCGQFVLRGGSCATPESHVRRTYRNFFGPDAAWQFSGTRLARDPV